jgi:hypothetical protein
MVDGGEMTAPDSFHSWLTKQIAQALNRTVSGLPLVIWCDPNRVWRDLLIAAKDGAFEVWADEEVHELILRERLYLDQLKPKVIWLPKRQEEITYLKVFELQAADVREQSLVMALSIYGIDIPSDRIDETGPQLPYLLKDGFDLSISDLKKEILPLSEVQSIDLLEILSATGSSFQDLIPDELFPMFARKAKMDYGLPDPTSNDPDGWREGALASLLCTEAASIYPHGPTADTDKIIPEGRSRNNALGLLSKWQKNIDLLESFEDLVRKADRRTSLQYWASGLDEFPEPLSSRCAEIALFKAECKRLSALDDFEDLARHLNSKGDYYEDHAKSFWGRLASSSSRVRWSLLGDMAFISSLLHQNSGVEQKWNSPNDAVIWFTSSGWQVDQAGETLFKENSEMPSELLGVRLKLRKAYLRHLDRTNRAFSELVANYGMDSLLLPFAGKILGDYLKDAKEPIAVLVLDAFRYDLGCRLSEMLNKGEPAQRSEVKTVISPIPSVTFLGMPFALPGLSDKLHVELSKATWKISADGFEGDLALASERRRWLKSALNIKEKGLISVTELLDSNPEVIKPKSLGKVVFAFGDELDVTGHDGLLKISGSDDNLERYAQAIRRLRSGGYSTVVIVTDHGFFHWVPDKDEVEPKPEGDVIWTSRRAICGRDLRHPSASKLKVTSSNLECMVPRSINAFSTYGGLGFFHGGTTLQEIIIPVVIAKWPKKAQKIKVVLKPVSQIVSLSQRVEVAPGVPYVQKTLGGHCALNEKSLSRRVLVKVISPSTGKAIFKSSPENIEPAGETKTVELKRVEGADARIDSKLEMMLLDADDDEVLDRADVTLKVELDEWF